MKMKILLIAKLLSAFQDSNIKYVKGDFSLDSILSKQMHKKQKVLLS